ncbi:hypothetical protein M513_06860 [Trichuris suis]|uniref:Uncharacterized protein n=1 Tax=Trichuris suis TaxID=68888 RepID=A0A085M501_9BILA|nr:hypothetical protein M513_06860 [Trichuris suis]
MEAKFGIDSARARTRAVHRWDDVTLAPLKNGCKFSRRPFGHNRAFVRPIKATARRNDNGPTVKVSNKVCNQLPFFKKFPFVTLWPNGHEADDFIFGGGFSREYFRPRIQARKRLRMSCLAVCWLVAMQLVDAVGSSTSVAHDVVQRMGLVLGNV